MKKNKEIEELLLNDSNYEAMIKAKIEREFKAELKNSVKKDEFLFNIKKVPAGKLFSRDAVYEVINKKSKTKSYINGIQADGYLGTQNNVRNKLLTGETDSFVSGDCYVKFIKAKL